MAIYYLLCPCCQQNLRTVSSHPHLILSCDKCTLHWQLKMIEAGRFLVKYDTETQKADLLLCWPTWPTCVMYSCASSGNPFLSACQS